MAKGLEFFQDGFGFFGHRLQNGELDFGDAAQRLGLYVIFKLQRLSNPQAIKILRDKFRMQLKQITLPSGEPVRHWDGNDWPGLSGTMSKDNYMCLLIAMILLGMKAEFFSWSWKLIKRGGFFWNTKKIGQWSNDWKIPDFAGPETWGIIVRGFVKFYPLMYLPALPILWVLDTGLVFASLARLVMSLIDPDDTSNDTNHIPRLWLAKKIAPTSISDLSQYLYSFRGRAGENKSSRLKGFGPQTALTHYFRAPGAPPLDYYGRPLVKELFGIDH